MISGSVSQPMSLPSATPHSLLVAVSETLSKTVCFSREAIAAFSRGSGDTNPLHLDPEAARRAGFADAIASGQQTAAMLMGMLATHYSRSDDGVAREMLCLNMNFAFKEPVLAGQPITLQWRVASVEWKEKLQGMLAHLDGAASLAPGKLAVIARGTILIKEADPMLRSETPATARPLDA